MKKWILVLTAALAFCSLNACVNNTSSTPLSQDAEQVRTISVSGTGTAVSSPDQVSFSFTVQNEGEDKEEVQNTNTQNTNAILQLLKDSQVSEKDIKTSDYNLSERWDYEKNAYDGYRASQTITISRQDADTAGALISLLGQQEGVSNINGPIFNDSNSDAVYQDALSAAIQNAKDKAERIADENDLEIVEILEITEKSSYTPVARYYSNTTMMAKASVEDVSIESGESEVSAEVDLLVKIKDKEAE